MAPLGLECVKPKQAAKTHDLRFPVLQTLFRVSNFSFSTFSTHRACGVVNADRISFRRRNHIASQLLVFYACPVYGCHHCEGAFPMLKQSQSKACHNCRRRRLKCDCSYPSCHKCSATGQECLGYGKLFLWNQGVASRGKMMGKSYARPAQAPVPRPGARGEECRLFSDPRTVINPYSSLDMISRISLQRHLTDPLFQNMDSPSRRYLLHCTPQ